MRVSWMIYNNIIIIISLARPIFLCVQSLRCRTGVQQTDDQYQKIMQICKKRSTSGNDNDNNDSSSSEDEDGDDSSSVDLFGTKFFINGDSKFSNVQSWKESNQNR